MKELSIMLDPGHGAGVAHNRGFVNIPDRSYNNEGDNNFIFVRDYLTPEFLEYEGIRVGNTRQAITDNPSIEARGKMAKGYDLLISSHTNAASGTGQGVEIWDSTNPKESIKVLCDAICANIAKEIGTVNRGTKYKKSSNGSNYYGVLRNGLAKHNFIIEYAFHDNYNDIIKFVGNMKGAAEATAKAIADYYGLKKKGNTVDPVPPVQNNNTVKIRYKDSVKEVSRILKDDTNYVNVREVLEFTGHRVDWNGVDQEIVIDGDTLINSDKEITGYGKYFKTEHLEVVETYPNGIYTQFVGGKTCRQTGAYSGSGVYFDPSTAPVTSSRSIVAIAVNGGKPIGENSHTADYTNRYKRGAIVTRPDNTAEFIRINNISEIKREYDVVLGGISMGTEYNPVKEGFIPANKNDDVLRSTFHTALACKKDRVYHITSLGNCTLAKFNEYIMKELGLEHIIGLDGGGSSQLYFEGDKGKISDRILPMVIGFKKVG
ncbi:MAG: hypothetical protein GXZ08_02520 [Tissierellia bacterium]|nr:hypothetical protein [Tissierellia bacterium]